MKRSIIYVFGPKRLAHQYRESINIQNSRDSCDVTNWLKIGMTTSEDDNLDKWEVALNRIKQESRTGISEICLSWMFSNIHILKGSQMMRSDCS